jgi:hypothetical protein
MVHGDPHGQSYEAFRLRQRALRDGVEALSSPSGPAAREPVWTRDRLQRPGALDEFESLIR